MYKVGKAAGRLYKPQYVAAVGSGVRQVVVVETNATGNRRGERNQPVTSDAAVAVQFSAVRPKQCKGDAQKGAGQCYAAKVCAAPRRVV